MTYAMLRAAAAEVAARCDGAHDEDGVGFNGTDTTFGKALAAMPLEAITDEVARAGWLMLRKYKGQLAAYGVDFDEIPEPAGGDGSKDYRYVDVLDGLLAFRFPYNPTMIDRVKASVPGARFNGGTKCWVAPASAKALAVAEANGFAVSEAARDLAKDAPAVAASLGRVSLDEDTLVIAFRYHPQAVAAVKDIPGRSFDPALKRWVAPLGSREQVLAFAAQFDLEVDAAVADITEEAMADSMRPRVTLSGGDFMVTFPFDRDMVARIKEIPGAAWGGRAWYISTDAAADVAEWIDRHDGIVDEAAKGALMGVEEERAIIAASKAEDGVVDILGLKRDLMPFQRGGVVYALARLGFAS